MKSRGGPSILAAGYRLNQRRELRNVGLVEHQHVRQGPSRIAPVDRRSRGDVDWALGARNDRVLAFIVEAVSLTP